MSSQAGNNPEASSSNSTPEAPKPTLALPSPEDAEERPITLDVDGDKVALGMVIVNEDGSLARVSNWDKMTENEQKNMMRVLGKRNQKRLDALKAKEGQS